MTEVKAIATIPVSVDPTRADLRAHYDRRTTARERNMRVGEICTVQTIYCKRDETVQGAALLMRKYHVGDVVVIDSLDREHIPVGIITDRDIVVSVIALGLDPASLLVGDIMTEDLLTASERRRL